jgi:glycosyltransferase involved in cell wall biosynthesis
MNEIVFSIAIPTFNRAEWLRLCLTQLLPQVAAAGNDVEVTVYDNASPDNTPEVARSFIEQGYACTYVRNTENIGSDRNIAQCFNRAKGRYVLILGDDDVFLDGALQKVMTLLRGGDYGAVFANVYGYDSDFRKELPVQFFAGKKVYSDANEFIKKCFFRATFISSLIINKSSCRDLDANKFAGTALVQTYLFYEAVFSRPYNVYISEYLLAAKRVETKDYDVVDIFCDRYNRVLEAFGDRGLLPVTKRVINRKVLLHFFPFHLLFLRANDAEGDRTAKVYDELYSRYHSEPLFWLCCMPMLKLPSELARLWGYGVIVVGRMSNGEFGRLWVAARERLNKKG